MRSVRDHARDGVCVVAAVSAVWGTGAAGTKPEAEAMSATNTAGGGGSSDRTARGAHALGAAQAKAGAGARAAREAVASGEHDRRIAKREGLVVARKKRRQTEPYTEPPALEVRAPYAGTVHFGEL